MEKQDFTDSIVDFSRYWKKKLAKRKKYLQERKKMLMNLAKKCSILLKQRFNVKEVYLIGSLARNYKIHEKSDIDLVVVGLLDKKYFSALKELYQLVPKGVEIDLITEETASKSMKTKIKKEGVLI